MALEDNLVSALIGALAAVILREGFIWIWRPRLEVDFEEFGGKKPYVHQFTETGSSMMFQQVPPRAIRVLRLRVHDGGGRAAEACEAKLEVRRDGALDPAVFILHWARRDPRIFKELDQVYAPVTINRGGSEALDVLRLAESSQRIESISTQTFWFEPNVKYELTVVITSANAGPVAFRMMLEWDGAWDGLGSSVARESSFPILSPT